MVFPLPHIAALQLHPCSIAAIDQFIARSKGVVIGQSRTFSPEFERQFADAITRIDIVSKALSVVGWYGKAVEDVVFIGVDT